MKRFYCTICKRRVRVRKLPSDVKPVYDDLSGLILRYTDGTCRHHTSTEPRRVLQDRVRVQHTPTRKATPVAAATPAASPSKSKGKGQRKAS